MWKVLGQVFGEETPMGTEARRAFLLRHHIAMWDVLAACTIRGAEDSSIADAVPNVFGRFCRKRLWSIFTPPDERRFLCIENISSRLRGGRDLPALHLTGQLPLGDRGYAHRSVQRAESGRRGMNPQANGEKHPKHTDFSRKVESYG